MAIVLPFRAKKTAPDGITGAFFWAMSLTAQRRRIRELAASKLPIITICRICRISAPEVMEITEDKS